MACVDGNQLLDTMPFGDREQQCVDIRQPQLTVALEECGGSLLIAFARREQLDPALSCPAQHCQGRLGRAMRRISRAKQCVSLSDDLPYGAELPTLAATGPNGCDRGSVVLVGFREYGAEPLFRLAILAKQSD